VPVGTLLGQQPPRPPRWHALVQWRDWKLPVKLAAITLVPIVIALILGVVTIANQVERAEGYQRIDRLVSLNESLRGVLDGLQRERTETAAMLTRGTVGDPPALTDLRAKVDAAVPPLYTAAERAGEYEPRVVGPNRELADQLDRLAGIRTAAATGQLDPVQAVNDYTAVTSAVLKVDTTLVAGISDDAIGGAPSAMHDLEVAKENLSVQQALVDYGIARGNLAPAEVNQLRTAEVRLADRLADFRASASQVQRQDFDSTAAGPNVQTRERLIDTVLGDEGTPSDEALRSIPADRWFESSSAVIQRVSDVSSRLGIAVSAVSADLTEEASSNAGLLAVLLFAALLLAAAVVFLINRQLLRSLSLLRAGALDIADKQLPAAVHNIQEGRQQTTDITPVPVDSRDEVGEVARAFDAVHSQALRLAVDQAALRAGYGTVFVNLSRRSQSLVQRQLQLIERLERDEEDADQLATLFQLDHLATRMRRNNENLMVLSGSEPGRRSGAPITTTDVLRAAVSEIEQYQRVVVQPPPSTRIVGFAASDLMRLVAELLDNATAFSAPETSVTVATRLADDRTLSIDILDKGIGMNEAEVQEANNRLTEAASVDLATSRRMGLFVVGRLASRHGIDVTLHGGKDIAGVRATVTVPAGLVLDAAGPALPIDRPAPPPVTGSGPGPLPQRRRPANGTTRSGALAHFSANQAEVGAQRGAPQIERTNGSEAPVAPRVNGLAPQPAKPADRAPEVEVSGTALFTPVAKPAPDENGPKIPGPATVPEGEAEGEGAGVPPASPELGSLPPAGPATADAETTTDTTTDADSDTDTDAEAGTARRQSPSWDDMPGGKSLFTANSSVLSDWWKEKAAAGDAERAARDKLEPSWISETTPIFDAMLSVWFRATGPPPAPADPTSGPDAAPAGEQPSNWDFAADERWRTVHAVSRAEPDSFTASGLPRRRRGEQLLPGSAAGKPARVDEAAEAAEAPARSELPVRDPGKIRGRLSSFQEGVSRGRKRTTEFGGTGGTEPGPAGPAHETPPQNVPEAAGPQGPVDGGKATDADIRPAEHAGTSTDPVADDAPGAQAPPEQVVWPQAQAAEAGEARADAGWTFATDDRWRTVQSASQAAPAGFTPAGLPRRRRGEQLMPGSAAPSNPTSGPRAGRDAQDVRGRLSSFQQGIRRGRHRSAQSTDGNQEKVEGE